MLSYRPSEGARLSRRRHCSKGVQPVPKAAYHTQLRSVYRSDFTEKRRNSLQRG